MRGGGEAADKKAEAASKIGDRAATNFAADASKVSTGLSATASQADAHVHLAK